MTQTRQMSYAERLTETLPAVRERIARATEAAGRDEGSVRLIAVTKAHPFEAVEAAIAAGLTDLGENRVGEFETKIERFGLDDVRWHMIGHVQSRKASRVLDASLVHSIDSTKLAEKLARAAAEREREVGVLVQVNTSGEESKYGFSPEEALEDVPRMAELPGLRVHGLMTMAPFVDDASVLSRTFEGLRTLSERLISSSDRVGAELSMGMTNDLDVAIREGSTMVRIGTALFGQRGSAQ